MDFLWKSKKSAIKVPGSCHFSQAICPSPRWKEDVGLDLESLFNFNITTWML